MQSNAVTVRAIDIDSWLECGTIIRSAAGKLLLAWGKRQWLPAFDPSSEQPVFYFPNFFLDDEKPWFVQPFTAECSLPELRERLMPRLEQAGAVLPAFSWSSPSFEAFSKAFAGLQQKIKAKEIDKAVPYVFEQASQTMTPGQLVRALTSVLQYAEDNPVAVYGFWDADQGVLGGTPELLFQRAGPLSLKTMACAGTVANGASEDDRQSAMAFMQDPKEVHEHKLVIQGIEESLGAFGAVQVGATQLLKLASLSHQMTPIHVQLNQNGIGFEQIAQALHPTPALGAFPRQAGRQWLKEYHKLIPRHRFGAPAGYLFPAQNRGRCYVSIRNVQWDRQAASIGAGCGIVAGSQCEREWNEINLKLRAIKEMLAL